MRALLGCAAVLALCFCTSADDKKNDKIDAKLLVGKWEPKEQPKGVSVRLEFTKDGKMAFEVVVEGKASRVDGTYKVEGDRLIATVQENGKDDSHTSTITKLTDTELTMKDDKGKEEVLVRIKDKK